MHKHYTLQVGDLMYAFQDKVDPSEFKSYEKPDGTLQIKSTTLAEPTQARFGPSLASYQEKWIFAIGGE